jgi:hypothetical protein
MALTCVQDAPTAALERAKKAGPAKLLPDQTYSYAS